MIPSFKKIFANKAFKIAFYYCLFGALWILVSDKVVDYLFPDKEIVSQLQMYKGWLYVVITGSLIYHLIWIELQKISKAEFKVIETQQRFNDIAENAEEWIWELDSTGTYLYSSIAVKKLLGYEPDELVGKMKFQDLFAPGLKDELKKMSEDIFGSKISFVNFQNKKIGKNGRQLWLLTNAYVVLSEDGRLIGYRGTDYDITDRVEKELQLRESEERYRSIFDAYTAGLIILNSSFDIVMANPTACEIYGYTAEEMRKLSMQNLISEVSMKKHLIQASEILAQGKNIEFDSPAIKKGGNIFVTHIMLTQFSYRDSKHILALISDITEKKLAEEELRKYKNHLEYLVAERTQELEDVNKLLEQEIRKQKESESVVKAALAKEKELNDLKSGFLSMASHEFRTPLTSILSSADLLARYGKGWEEEKNLYHIDKIRNSVNHMNVLLNDVLTINQTQNGKINPKFTRVNLKIFLEDLIADVKNLSFFNHNIQMNLVNLEDSIYTDPKLLRQCLENLVVNAVKYSAAGSDVIIDAQKNTKMLTIAVRDHGRGIPEEELTKVFEPFYRIKSSVNLPGSGLGLAIVKNAVTFLNGSIAAESSVGTGTVFTLTLPLTRKEEV